MIPIGAILRVTLAVLVAGLLAACEGPSYPLARPDGSTPDARGPAIDETSAAELGAPQPVTQAEIPPEDQSPLSGPTYVVAASEAGAATAVELTATPVTEAKPQPIIRPGTDQFVNPAAFDRRVIEAPDDGEITLNFADADIREVVRTILGDVLGLNYAIDPGVGGVVTLQTSRPIRREDLLATLESVLRLNGAALIQGDGLYKIVSWDAVKAVGSQVRGVTRSARDAGYGIQVVPLRYIAASEMAKTLEPFAPAGSIVQVDPKRNLLLLAGSRDEQATLLETIALFDVDWFAGMSFGLFPLDNAIAQTLVEELELIFPPGGEKAEQPIVRFRPVDRLNAVLVISSRASYLAHAQDWIRQLDQAAYAAGQRVYVYKVQNVDAVKLAEVLGDIFNLRQGGSSPVSAAPTTDFGVIELDAGRNGGSETAPDAPSAAGPARDSRSRAAFGDEKSIRLIADEVTNSIVILATPQQYRLVEEALRQLDLLPLQVLVEATILEVRLTDELRYGVQWFLESGDFAFTLSDAATGLVNPAFPGFSTVFTKSSDVRVVVDALSAITDVNVISSPLLMVLDNQTAELQVGDEVPISTQSSVSVSDANAPVVNQIQFRDTGVILRVTPHVSSGGLVVMDIEQEVSDAVSTTSSGIDSPTIQQRRVISTVAIQSGETVTLGGLIRDNKSRTKSGLPLLSEIPILGNLFSSTRNRFDRVELLILIKPQVVRDAREAREVTDELRKRIRSVQPLAREIEAPKENEPN